MVIHMVQGQMKMLKFEVKFQGHTPPQPDPSYLQTSLPPVCFELTIPAGVWPKTYAFDRSATGTSNVQAVLYT